MSDPKTLNSHSFFYKPLGVIVVTILIFSGILIALNYNSIDDQIPVLFNYPMSENGMAVKQSLWELLIFFSIVVIIFFLLRKSSFPNDSLAFPPVKKELANKLSFELFGLLALVSALSCLVLVSVTIYVAKENIVDGKSAIYPALPIIMVGIPVVYLIRYFAIKK